MYAAGHAATVRGVQYVGAAARAVPGVLHRTRGGAGAAVRRAEKWARSGAAVGARLPGQRLSAAAARGGLRPGGAAAGGGGGSTGGGPRDGEHATESAVESGGVGGTEGGADLVPCGGVVAVAGAVGQCAGGGGGVQRSAGGQDGGRGGRRRG